ncbi:MAG: MFS transporter [Candidatus Thermoplasmatota archaeon]|nr:MFS transporter [Candidatus Thermoplasmatota archaeon]
MFKRIAAIQILTGGASMASFTYISLYAREISLSNLEITIIAALFATASFLSAYLFGRAADRYGRRRTLIIGLSCASFFVLLQAVGMNFPVLAGGRLLAGIGFGMFPAALAVYAYEADIRMGKFSSFASLGWGLALPISGAIAKHVSITAVFVFASALVLASLIISLNLPRIREARFLAPLLPFKMILKNHRVLLPLIIRHSSASAIWVLWPLFLRDRIGLDLFEIGLIQATNAFTQFTTFYLIGDKVPPKPSMVGGLIMTAIAATSFILIQSFPLFLITQVFLGMSWSLMYIGALRIMLRENDERATATGLLNSSISISALFGPGISLIIVAVLPHASYEGPMVLAAVASALAALYFASLSLLQGRDKAQSNR